MNVAKHNGSPLTLRRGVGTGCLVVLMSIAGMTTPASSYADEPLPAAAASYPIGKITSIYEKTFQIDGRTYNLTSDAVILDDSGNQADVGMLAVTLEVKYHVKKDQNDKIDRMIIFLPR